MDTIFNMPMDEAEARYLRPTAQPRSFADYLPNVFGGNPAQVAGLLGEQQAGAISRQANVSGLLGAAIALANGMSPQGYRRSAAQNILNALGAGFQSSQAGYQAGMHNVAQQQQMQSAINRQRALAMLAAKYPDLAEMFQVAPDKAMEIAAQRERMVPVRKAYEDDTPPTQVVVPSPVQSPEVMSVSGDVPSLPAVEVNASSVKQDPMVQRLTAQRDRLIRANTKLTGLGFKEANDEIKSNLEQIKAIEDQIVRINTENFDATPLIQSMPPEQRVYAEQLSAMKDSRLITGDQFRQGIERLAADGRQRVDGAPAMFAMQRFGTTDLAKMKPEQVQEVLTFTNLPNAEQQARLRREAADTKFTTGQDVPVPQGRESMIGGRPAPQVQPQTAQPVPQSAEQPTQQVGTQPAQKPATQANQQKPAPQTPTSFLTNLKAPPLILQPDDKVPPKKKQELLAAKPSDISLANYSITQIKDARDAAQRLRDNPKLIKAIAGFDGKVFSFIPGTDAYDADALLQNLQMRSFVTELQQMRQSSPTGGAVGNVAVKEMEGLSNIRAALKVGMTEAEIKNQLDQFVRNSDRALKTIPLEYARTYGYQGEFDDVLSGRVVSENQTPGVRLSSPEAQSVFEKYKPKRGK